MSTKAIILGNIAPPRVHDRRPIFLWSNAILPLIGISETTTRPAKVGYVQVLERFHHVVSNTFCMRDRGIVLPNIKATVNTTTQMYCKMSIDVLVDDQV